LAEIFAQNSMPAANCQSPTLGQQRRFCWLAQRHPKEEPVEQSHRLVVTLFPAATGSAIAILWDFPFAGGWFIIGIRRILQCQQFVIQKDFPANVATLLAAVQPELYRCCVSGL
jgi:hypothetical protein